MPSPDVVDMTCPVCGISFRLEITNVAPEVLKKLLSMSWACDDCGTLDAKIRQSKERLAIAYESLAGADSSERKRSIKSRISGQQTDLRFLQKRLEDHVSEQRQKNKVEHKPPQSNDPF